MTTFFALLRLVVFVLLVRWAIVDPDVNNWLILAFLALGLTIEVEYR